MNWRTVLALVEFHVLFEILIEKLKDEKELIVRVYNVQEFDNVQMI